MEISNKENILQSIITKAWEDKAFKTQLLTNPKEAIEDFTGQAINLPEGKQLIVTDQTNESVIYINIPTEPNMESLELSEEQLEAVAGGNPVAPLLDDTFQDLMDLLSGKDGR
ncbi:NHLP leader peptide family RiPP precursor [uncultured Dokdonia sp.]|uniref:NHLP leader peptide family RiPP precursor n=1 Tax=uncultured Dokdonia sp. TaxID=575653 RepID=UPI00262B8C7E|nr:NHLP leader peptide family RiPP precursor [uncultured Dokdonia sp.]